MTAQQRYAESVNRLAKWRTVFTGRMVGTSPKSDPTTQGWRDLFERQLIFRAEASAIIALLIEKGVCTHDEFLLRIAEEADALSKLLEERFPGFEATDYGMKMDPVEVRETTRGWPK